jgi:hypothetical protein
MITVTTTTTTGTTTAAEIATTTIAAVVGTTTTTEGCGTMRLVLRPPFIKKMGPVGLFITAYDIWRRIPPHHRRRITAETRKHAPAVARAVRDRARRGPR